MFYILLCLPEYDVLAALWRTKGLSWCNFFYLIPFKAYLALNAMGKLIVHSGLSKRGQKIPKITLLIEKLLYFFASNEVSKFMYSFVEKKCVLAWLRKKSCLYGHLHVNWSLLALGSIPSTIWMFIFVSSAVFLIYFNKIRHKIVENII